MCPTLLGQQCVFGNVQLTHRPATHTFFASPAEMMKWKSVFWTNFKYLFSAYSFACWPFSTIRRGVIFVRNNKIWTIDLKRTVPILSDEEDEEDGLYL